LITTAPGVRYRVTTTAGEVLDIDSPASMPDTGRIDKIEEPFIEATILTSDSFLGGILPLLDEKRGIQKKFEYISETRVMLVYEIPLNEIVLDFYDRLKSVSKGYASLDYHMIGYRDGDLVKLDILVSGEPVDALSLILHRSNAATKGRAVAAKMKELIPRQLFEVPIQAAIGNKVIARETVKSMGKNVLAKCYGGDISRKRKLLEKQKEGKKRMKKVGRVEIPQDAFLAVLKVSENQ
jgi:GTP-binding protein LepA